MKKSWLSTVDSNVDEQSLLKHPFYRMWSAGELTLRDLQIYANEYFELVKAVPELVSSIIDLAPDDQIRERIMESLEEEREHVELWIKFAEGIGVPRDELNKHVSNNKTKAAIAELRKLASQSFEEAMATMYAYESELPKISRSKIDGLKQFYGIEDLQTLNYFLTHEKVDIKHAALWRKILSNRITPENEPAVIAAANASLVAQNKMLDSVLEICQGNKAAS